MLRCKQALKKKYIDTVNRPSDLRNLSSRELKEYCAELREFIIAEVSKNPGHLGSSLGVVELTAALHYVYNTPYDKIIWDVGHQAYAHKIITGRRDNFHTNRKFGGISGFPAMSESEYDAFGTGHASTSISAALGMAAASGLRGEERHVIAVIGDGALTGGLAYEGLNNAGAENLDILVILNDNNMAIDKNVGAMKEYLLDITTSMRYNRLKKHVWKGLSFSPSLRRALQKLGNMVKSGLLQQSNLFESLNFRYFGPVDGSDVVYLAKVLNDLKKIKGPKLLHVLTVKGHGYTPAEKSPSLWHSPGRFNPETGELERPGSGDEPPKYQDVFGRTIVELARINEKIVGITPAMPSGCSLHMMMEEMPERVYDVGIAEGHAVTFSAGLAAGGMLPFCNIYSSFMQRAYDNVIHDVAVQNLDVVFCLDRSGIVGEDGATHQGVFDVAFFRPIPNMTVAAPMNEIELRNLMYSVQQGGYGPFAIRYPRGKGVCPDWEKPFETIPVGKGRLLREGRDVVVISLGHPGNFAAQAIEMAEKEGVSAAHIDLRFAKPLDEELLHYAGRSFKKVITVEDGIISGGAGSAVLEFFNHYGYNCKVTLLGVPDMFVPHGTPDELRRVCGFDTESIYRELKGCKGN